jgi:hypothetical protein
MPHLSFLTWPRLVWWILRPFAFCAIAKTRKSNYEIAHHTFWSGFAASGPKDQGDGVIAENSAIAEKGNQHPELNLFAATLLRVGRPPAVPIESKNSIEGPDKGGPDEY